MNTSTYPEGATAFQPLSEPALAPTRAEDESGEPFRMAEIAVPAHEDYLALARLAMMQVAGLLGLPVQRLTDLRLAVNEACALLLGGPAQGTLYLRFERCAGELRVTVRGPAPAARPEPEEIGWLMLRALLGDVRMETVGGQATLTLVEPLPAR